MGYHKSLLRWAGGKYHALPLIIPLLNPRKNSAEIFGGGISITLNLPKVLKHKTEIISDINDNWYNFWTVIKNQKDDYMKEIEFVFAGDAWIEEYRAREDPIGRAIFFYLMNRNGMAGFGHCTKKDKAPHTFPNNPVIKDITWWSKRLQNVRIYKLDAFELIETINNLTTDWLIILDPPYVKEGRKGVKMYAGPTGNAGQDEEIDFGFDKKDHEHLADVLHDMKQEVFMTYDNDPLIRELYSDWNIREARWHYHGAKGPVKKTKTELFISNFPFKDYSKSTGIQNWGR